MVTQELLSYIKQKLQGGMTQDALKKELMSAQWSEADVTAALTMVEKNMPAPPPSSDKTQVIITVIGLFLFYPFGVIFMWMWMKQWPTWVKILLSLPLLIIPFAILVGIVLISINPQKQFNIANDTKRQADITTLLSAIDQYQADNRGSLPFVMTRPNEEIASGSHNADICASLTPKYLAFLPQDPSITGGTGSMQSCASYDTGYTITQQQDGKLTIKAPLAQSGKIISVTR